MIEILPHWENPTERIVLSCILISPFEMFHMSHKNKVWQFYLIQHLESHYTQVYFLFNVKSLTLLIRNQHPGIHSCGIYLSFHIFVPWFSSIPGLFLRILREQHMGRQAGLQVFWERHYYAENYLRQFWWNIFQCRFITIQDFSLHYAEKFA